MEKYLIQFLEFIRKRLVFIDGLLVLLIITGLIYFWVAKEVGCHVLQIAKSCGLPNAEGLADPFFLIGLAVALFISFIFWCRHRSVPKFGKDEFGILFAPDFDEEIEREVDRLFVNLRHEIKSHEIGNRFSLKRLPANLSISSASEATVILRNAGGAVAVWGTMEQQSGNDGRITGFSHISITFLHPALLSESRLETLAFSMVGRKFHVNERTQIIDRKMMARDIGLIVRNMLGVALMLGLKFKEAIRILGPLHANLQATLPGKRPLPLQCFCLQVQYDLAYSLTKATSEQYREFLFKDYLYEIPQPLIERWLKNVDQAISLDSQNSLHFINKAIYLFLSGDIEGAITAEKKADKLAPRASSVQNISLAFLYNFKGNLQLSRNQYRIGLAKKTSYNEEMISQCLSFIRQTIAKFPEKKQLRLALAVLELRRGSKEVAIRSLEELLADPPRSPELQGFINEARNLLRESKYSESLDKERE